MAVRKFAVFDIDGTVIRWQLYHALVDELARSGQFDSDQYQKVRAARMEWKTRLHPASFQDYEQALVDLVNATISMISVEDFNAACARVIAEYKDQVYTYTRGLIQQLKAADYLLFAISASQIEIVQMIADYYGFDDCGGSHYKIKNGYFTIEKQVLRRKKKPKLLQQLVTKHQASWQGSIAVGDSESDIPLLESVEQPVAFNPTRELFAYAESRHWKIVVERKNVIYELESRSGHYQLST